MSEESLAQHKEMNVQHIGKLAPCKHRDERHREVNGKMRQ